MAVEHPPIVLDSGGLRVGGIDRNRYRFVGIRQYFAEQFVASGRDEQYQRERNQHFKGQHQRHRRFIDMQRRAKCRKIHRPAGINARHHGRHVRQVVDTGRSKHKKAGHYSHQHRHCASQQRKQRFRERLCPQFEIAPEQHQRDGYRHRQIHQPILHLRKSSGFGRVGFKRHDTRQRHHHTNGISQNYGSDFLQKVPLMKRRHNQNREQQIDRQNKINLDHNMLCVFNLFTMCVPAIAATAAAANG